MKSRAFSSPISRMFPKKIVNYLIDQVDEILGNEKQTITDRERMLLEEYKQDLQSNKMYYEKVNLDFVRKIYPKILNKESSEPLQRLYSEILRINPRLLTTRLGNELLFKNLSKQTKRS